MEEAGVDGVLIVQPIFHKFDHSYVTRFVSHFAPVYARNTEMAVGVYGRCSGNI